MSSTLTSHAVLHSKLNRSRHRVVSFRARAVASAKSEEVRPAPTRLHFVGIGGSGVSALALVALSQGYAVSGSDLKGSAQLERVRAEGATCYVGHVAENVGSRCTCGTSGVPGDIQFEKIVPDALVVSSAVPERNVEVLFAKEAGIPIYNRSQWLARITKRKAVVAVAGTHGKTTTSAMLSVVMQENNFDITALVGGRVRQFPGQANALGGNDTFLVIEADEYDGAFLGLKPTLAIITNIDFEHPDMFDNLQDVQNSFARFIRRLNKGGSIIACGDDANVRKLQHSLDDKVRDFVTFGFGEENRWRAFDISANAAGGSDFSVTCYGKYVCKLSLPLPGRHNVLNALVAMAAAHALMKARDNHWTPSSGTEFADVSQFSALHDEKIISKTVAALEGYQGIVRRLQHIGSVGNCAIYDDYAHHPTAIRAVIMAMREQNVGARLVVAFQPHTFSRTAALLHEFADALSLADRVIVTSVYDARGEIDLGLSNQVSGQDLARLVGDKCIYIESLQDSTRQLCMETKLAAAAHQGQVNQVSRECVSGTTDLVILCLGAGSSNQLSTVVHTALRMQMEVHGK